MAETSQEVEHGSLRLLTETIAAKTSRAQLDVIKEIGYAISKSGLALGDAALLSRTTLDELTEWTNEVPEIGTYFRLKMVEYKYGLLKVITAQAVENKDVKQAMWLLEQQFDDYNPAARKAREKMPNNGEDTMALAIAFIRQSNSEGTPVEATSQEQKQLEEVKFRDVSEVLS